MKAKILFICLIILTLAFNNAAQSETKKANPADVASVDAIMKAVYDVISGEAGEARDWDRFRTLFHKDARLIPTGKNSTTGIVGARALSPDDYIKGNAPFFEKNGFFEKEIARKTDIYGNIAQVFSTYAAYKTAADKEPFMRGINSFQLLNDGTRWWVLTIYWQAETKETPIPKKYLKKSR